MRVLLTAGIIDAAAQHLAAHEPERLLHVLGHVRPDGSLELTHSVFDEEAATSGVHVQASPRGENDIRALERSEGVTYLGILHSHPRGVPEPSSQDGRAAKDLLARNPHLQAVVVGVVVSTRTRRRGKHVHALAGGELAIHAAERGGTLAPAEAVDLDPQRDFYRGISARLPKGALDAVDQVRVLVVGAGSLGSTCAEHLVRAGVPYLTVIDPDTVQPSNLSRSIYCTDDLGRPKTEALAARLRSINPDVQVRPITRVIDPSSADELSHQISESNLVLGLADDMRALAMVDLLLHRHQRPGVFAGVYRGGVGGDIVTVVPGVTACFRCTVAPRVAATDLQTDVDYGTGRLQGEVALGSDIATLAAVTSRTALGVLGALRSTDTLLESLLPEGRTFMQMGLAPGFFDSTGLFAAVPAQHTFQSIWVRAEGDPTCPDCGQASIALSAQSLKRQPDRPVKQPTRRRGRRPAGRASRRIIHPLPG